MIGVTVAAWYAGYAQLELRALALGLYYRIMIHDDVVIVDHRTLHVHCMQYNYKLRMLQAS